MRRRRPGRHLRPLADAQHAGARGVGRHKPLEFLRRAATSAPMRRFATTDPDFDTEFDAFLAERRGMPADVDEAVAAVLEAVLSEGIEAVLRYTERFDRGRLAEGQLPVTP